MIATNDSVSMPPYPIMRMCPSLSIIFGVVPEEMSEWKPETAPQAMVMKRNGNRLPEKTGPVPSMNRVDVGHAQLRRDDVDADRERDDGADLEERRQVVARREHQPHRQAGSDRAVDDDRPRDLGAAERERGTPARVLGDRPTEPDRAEQQHDAERRGLPDAPRADEAHVDAHGERDRDRRGDRERAPRAFGERLDDHERQDREDDDHDRQHADERERARHVAELHLDHLAEGPAVAPHRDEQHDHVLDGAGEHDTGEEPQRAGQVAHLRREHRTDERPGAGDGREVMAVEHPLVGRDVVHPVVVAHRRCHPARVDLQHARGDVHAVVAVGEEVDRQGRRHEPDGAHGFAALERNGGECETADDCDRTPDQDRHEPVHVASFGGGRRRFVDGCRKL